MIKSRSDYDGVCANLDLDKLVRESGVGVIRDLREFADAWPDQNDDAGDLLEYILSCREEQRRIVRQKARYLGVL